MHCFESAIACQPGLPTSQTYLAREPVSLPILWWLMHLPKLDCTSTGYR